MISLPVPEAEFTDRMARAKALLDRLEVDTALILNPATQYWLCGMESFIGAAIPQALVLSTRPGAKTALVLWDGDLAIARKTSTVADTETYRFGVDQPAQVLAKATAVYAPGYRRVAMDMAAPALTLRFGRELCEALGIDAPVDCTLLFGRLCAVKSPAELVHMREAGRLAELAITAAREGARPGMTEIELAAELEYAMRRNGADYPSIPTELTSGPRSVLGHGTPTDRRLVAGDLVHLEVGGCSRRYNCVGIRTFVVPGATPDPRAAALYEVAREALSAGLSRLRAGAVPAEVEEPGLDVIRRAGWGDAFKMRFGYGVGVGYPPSWIEPVQITRTEHVPLEAGMTLVMHTCLLDEVHDHGVLVGGTYLVNANGNEMLAGAGPVGLA